LSHPDSVSNLVRRVDRALAAEANVGIPYPTHEVHLCRVSDDLTRVLEQPQGSAGSTATRFDPAAVVPAAPHLAESPTTARRFVSVAAADEDVGRALDR